ncbi:MAG: ATP-binding protein [Pseudomonadota bacterium]
MCNNDLQVDVIVPTQTRYLSLIGRIGEEIAKELDRYTGNRATLAYNLNLVLTEAMTNAIEHSAAGDSKKTVRVTIHIEEENLCIRVYDHGQGFDLDSVPVPDLNHPKEGGLGIFFIRNIMDSVSYRRTREGNILEMKKKLN